MLKRGLHYAIAINDVKMKEACSATSWTESLCAMTRETLICTVLWNANALFIDDAENKDRKKNVPGPTSSSPWAPSSHRSPTPTGPPRPWSRQHIFEHNQHHGLSIDSRGSEEGTDGNTARKLYSYTSESTFGIKSSLVMGDDADENMQDRSNWAMYRYRHYYISILFLTRPSLPLTRDLWNALE